MILNYGGCLLMDNKYLGVLVVVVALLLMYVGTTMFYNTGLTITDLRVEPDGSNSSEYNVSYMLCSVRGFNRVTMDYTLLASDGRVVGHGSDELGEIKDGSFQIDDKVRVDDILLEVKKIEVKLCEIDESNTQKVMFDQTFDV